MRKTPLGLQGCLDHCQRARKTLPLILFSFRELFLKDTQLLTLPRSQRALAITIAFACDSCVRCEINTKNKDKDQTPHRQHSPLTVYIWTLLSGR
jgi:hypothetical protein